jgi:hypothetical protein
MLPARTLTEVKMRAFVIALATVMLFAGNPAWAMALDMDQLMGVCLSTTLAEAAEAGDRLGWVSEDPQALEDWRSGFLGYNGGPVEVIGWRQGEAEKDEALSFWVAGGVNAHRACTYSASDGKGLLAALTDRFGLPKQSDTTPIGGSAYWFSDGYEIAFTHVASSALVNISFQN